MHDAHRYSVCFVILQQDTTAPLSRWRNADWRVRAHTELGGLAARFQTVLAAERRARVHGNPREAAGLLVGCWPLGDWLMLRAAGGNVERGPLLRPAVVECALPRSWQSDMGRKVGKFALDRTR
ncbi:hypothetical protein VTO73DRAFT_5608 [Trametes versicolor]